jgi:hypothetical protein
MSFGTTAVSVTGYIYQQSGNSGGEVSAPINNGNNICVLSPEPKL